MDEENTNKEYKFGNERFGGYYRPGEFELNLPSDLTREEFEDMFRSRMESLHKLGREITQFDDEPKSKREKLNPLSIRVKAHTKEFFKNISILSAREVLELYEDFNNSSEAFINSLLEDEKRLETELGEVHEKLHNAKLFKDKLNDMDLPKSLSDKNKIEIIEEEFDNTQIKEIDSQTSDIKAQTDIIDDIKTYNTTTVRIYGDQVLGIGVAGGRQPVTYFFKNDYSSEDISEIVSDIGDYCNENDIAFEEAESLF